MDQGEGEHKRRIREFLEREFQWRFSAGECNFLIQLLAYIIQANPAFVPNQKGDKEPLTYQSIRSIVLLNEKLSGQLQQKASEASVIISDMEAGSERVQ